MVVGYGSVLGGGLHGEGSTATFSCRGDRRLEGPAETTCQEGRWIPDPPHCLRTPPQTQTLRLFYHFSSQRAGGEKGLVSPD